MPEKLYILYNTVQIIFFIQYLSKIARISVEKNRATNNFLQIYFVTLLDYANEVSKEAKILTALLPLFSRLFRLLSSKILQKNSLDLYLVEIRR